MLEGGADSDQMFRVLYNLVRNAVQAFGSDPADDPALVQRINAVGPSQRDRSSRSGSPTPARACPPRRAKTCSSPSAAPPRSGGTGLGLAIARELVIAHGGSITLDETVAQGTAFRIELPDQPVPLDTFRARA